MRKALLVGLVLALAAPAQALGARWAVGAPPGRFDHVAKQLPSATTLVPGHALLVRGARPRVRGATYVIRLDGRRRHAARTVQFANTEPYAARQWYLDQDRAWSFWPQQPTDLQKVKVAVIDSGIDYRHPEFAGRVAAGRSFVGGSWQTDTDGHGTFVSGILAADPSNNVGIAGLGFNVSLLVGKVVQPDGVSLEAEVRAITWAVAQGARVINLSLGGVRDPHDLRLDTYSPLERDAIAYAYSRNVVVVAAVGNGPGSPSTPWTFAGWPSALPHVIGVAALRENGSVPDFSNRDPLFVDVAAPGDAIFSTIPRNLVDASRPGCGESEPFSDCGPLEFRQAIGTSFATPQVSAAAALLIGTDPSLTADQVMWLLERTATDVTGATCGRCPPGRDSLTGWGRLNVQAALRTLQRRVDLPPPDVYEPNDDVGIQAHAFGPPRTITATLDYWDDPTDVYALKLTKGQALSVLVTSKIRLGRLVLWNPATVQLTGGRVPLSNRAARSATVGGSERLSYQATTTGTYYLQVKVAEPTRARPVYDLTVVKEPAAAKSTLKTGL